MPYAPYQVCLNVFPVAVLNSQTNWAVVVAYAFIPSTREAEAGKYL